MVPVIQRWGWNCCTPALLDALALGNFAGDYRVVFRDYCQVPIALATSRCKVRRANPCIVWKVMPCREDANRKVKVAGASKWFFSHKISVMVCLHTWTIKWAEKQYAGLAVSWWTGPSKSEMTNHVVHTRLLLSVAQLISAVTYCNINWSISQRMTMKLNWLQVSSLVEVFAKFSYQAQRMGRAGSRQTWINISLMSGHLRSWAMTESGNFWADAKKNASHWDRCNCAQQVLGSSLT